LKREKEPGNHRLTTEGTEKDDPIFVTDAWDSWDDTNFSKEKDQRHPHPNPLPLRERGISGSFLFHDPVFTAILFVIHRVVISSAPAG
jgi:hypothetical protein